MTTGRVVPSRPENTTVETKERENRKAKEARAERGGEGTTYLAFLQSGRQGTYKQVACPGVGHPLTPLCRSGVWKIMFEQGELVLLVSAARVRLNEVPLDFRRQCFLNASP
jgi:hypothetical protein